MYVRLLICNITNNNHIIQLERDLFIWNHKKNIVNPIFVPEDKILKRFRVWYSQFYRRKRRITIRDANDNYAQQLMEDSRPCSGKLDF